MIATMALSTRWPFVIVLLTAITGVLAVRGQLESSGLTMAFAAPFMPIRSIDWG